MRRSRLLAAAALTAAVLVPSSSAFAASTLVPHTATWKVLDDGSNQTPGFAAPGFDDGAWSSHTVQAGKVLGYGDNGRANFPTQTPNINWVPYNGGKSITTYFRTTFTVTDPAAMTSLSLSVRRDDGVVVYLNGVEVARDNMPAGPITSTTFSSSIVDGTAEYTPVTSNLATTSLVAGTNVLAVELHQRDQDSSDISFAAELTGVELPADVPEAPLPALLVAGGAITATGVLAVRRRLRRAPA